MISVNPVNSFRIYHWAYVPEPMFQILHQHHQPLPYKGVPFHYDVHIDVCLPSHPSSKEHWTRCRSETKINRIWVICYVCVFTEEKSQVKWVPAIQIPFLTLLTTLEPNANKSFSNFTFLRSFEEQISFLVRNVTDESKKNAPILIQSKFFSETNQGK